MQASSYPLIQAIYNESKFWIAIGGFFFGLFRGIEWIKAIKNNDLHHIQMGVDSVQAGIKDQTTSIVTEIRELRNDMRTVTTALISNPPTRRQRT